MDKNSKKDADKFGKYPSDTVQDRKLEFICDEMLDDLNGDPKTLETLHKQRQQKKTPGKISPNLTNNLANDLENMQIVYQKYGITENEIRKEYNYN